MPFYLKDIDVAPLVARHASVLLAVCRFCPAASMATRYDREYLKPLKSGLKTNVFEDHLARTVASLERRGVRTSVFRGDLRNFMVCVWSAGTREELIRKAAEHEAVVVMGCRGAVESVKTMLGELERPVYHGMEDEGILAVTPRFGPAGSVRLDLFGVTPVRTDVAGVDRSRCTETPITTKATISTRQAC